MAASGGFASGVRSLDTEKLQTGATLIFPLYHESGQLLLAPGRVLSEVHLKVLREAAISTVYECESDEDVVRLKKIAGRSAIPIDSLAPGEVLSHPIHDEDGRILLKEGHALTPESIERLHRRCHDSVYKEPAGVERQREQVEKFKNDLASLLASDLDERVATEEYLQVRPDGEAFACLAERQRTDYSPQEQEAVLAARDEAVSNARHVLETLTRGVAVSQGPMRGAIDTLAKNLHDAPNLLLGLAYAFEKDDFLAEHAVSTASVSMAMGAVLGYGERQVKELGLAAFLSNIGMARVPPEILNKPGPLTPEEFAQVRRHPIHALDMLQQCSAVPEVVSLAIYQSHERDDGSGYPKKRHGAHIHDYARLLAVADMYVAMSSPRSHRPALLPYESMETLIHQASVKTIRPEVIRILLKAVALYPIGSWVQMSTGEIARVIASGGETFDRPIVRVLYDSVGNPLATDRVVDLRTESRLKVVRAVTPGTASPQNLEGFG
ncbi:MAG: HD domain-containing protein [Planctomycetes bacterium]|nr:HD domain-containing protein [Planctomycetota bacterium]